MASLATFSPIWGSGFTASVTATSGNTEKGYNSRSICLTNFGSNTAYVRTGVGSGTTATTADYPVLPQAQVTISKPNDHDYVAYVCDTGETASLHVIPGEGM